MTRKASASSVATKVELNGDAADTLPPLSDIAVRDLAQVFKLTSDETRLRILLYLAQSGELHVTDLARPVAAGGQPPPGTPAGLGPDRVAARG
jgi:ArsR family transcriptional regulator